MTKPKIEEIKSFFFEAMVNGYISGGDEIKISEIPEYRAIPFKKGKFYLLDNYLITPYSDKSAGTTTIWYDDKPVWVMHYGGYYKESAISLLKKALAKTYKSSQFFGGRGPLSLSESKNSLIYINYPKINDFEKFEGREVIFDTKKNICLGYHEYWGMSLL